jgi:uncharacterized protein YoxC
VASNHEATLTVKAQVADAQRKMHDLERTVDRLAKQLDNKSKKLDQVAKGSDRVGGSMLTVASKVANVATGVQSAAQMLDQFGASAAAMASVTANFSGNIDGLRKATRGLVDDQTLMIASNNAGILGVTKTGEEFEKLAAAAAKLGSAVGVEAGQAIRDVTEALGKGSPEVLNNIGVILKAEEAQKEYAAQLGKTVAQLTEQEKADAFRVIGMQRVIEKADAVNESQSKMGEGIQRVNVFIKNAIDNLGLLDKHILDFGREIALAAENGSVFASALDAISFGAFSSGRELEKLLRLVDEANERLARAEADANEMLQEMEQNNQAHQTRMDLIWIKHYQKGDRGASVMSEMNRLAKEHALTINGVTSAMSLLDGEVRKDVYGKIKKGLQELPREKKRGGGGGGRAAREDRPFDVNSLLSPDVGPSETQTMLDAQVSAAERMLTLEAAQEASLERRWQLQQQIFEAEMAAIENRLMGASDPEEAARIQEERDQLIFDQQVSRAEYQIALAQKRAQAEEAAARRIAEAHRRTAQAINDASGLAGGAIQGAADIASTAAEQHGQSAEAAEKKRRAWGAAILAVDAIFYGAKAAAAFAALNPIEGAGFLSAAIISGTKAAQMGASVSGVGGGGGRSNSAAGFGDRGPIQRDRANAPNSKVPGSAGSPTSLPGGAKGTSGTVVYVNTQVLGAIDEQAAVKIQRGIEDAARSGRIRMGRPS